MTDLDFSWRGSKDGRVWISRDGRVVTSLAGDSARRFLALIERLSDADAQLEMAKATGNYKRGNERFP